MKSTIIVTLALGAAGVSGLIAHDSAFPSPLSDGTCSFTLVANGPGSARGPVGQLDDGQNRIGGGHGTSLYYLHKKTGGGVVDSKGRGCILTPFPTQWQCDAGVGPHNEFNIGCDGSFTYRNSPHFYACPVNDQGEWNVYLDTIPNQNKCVPITLKAISKCPCAPVSTTLPPTPSKPSSTPSKSSYKPSTTIYKSHRPVYSTTGNATYISQKAQPTPPPNCTNDNSNEKGKDHCGKPSLGCSADLDGRYEFPHLIVPIDRAHRDVKFGNQFNGTITPDVCTAFNFDVHPDLAGKTCSLIFLLPHHEDLETSAYLFDGDGTFTFNRLAKPVDHHTSWNTRGKGKHLSTQTIIPGDKTVAWSGPCEAGKTVSYEMCSSDTYLQYFQDWNPSPIGMYLRQC